MHLLSFPGLHRLNLQRSTNLFPCNVAAEPRARPADSGLETSIPASQTQSQKHRLCGSSAPLRHQAKQDQAKYQPAQHSQRWAWTPSSAWAPRELKSSSLNLRYRTDQAKLPRRTQPGGQTPQFSRWLEGCHCVLRPVILSSFSSHTASPCPALCPKSFQGIEGPSKSLLCVPSRPSAGCSGRHRPQRASQAGDVTIWCSCPGVAQSRAPWCTVSLTSPPRRSGLPSALMLQVGISAWGHDPALPSRGGALEPPQPSHRNTCTEGSPLHVFTPPTSLLCLPHLLP